MSQILVGGDVRGDRVVSIKGDSNTSYKRSTLFFCW